MAKKEILIGVAVPLSGLSAALGHEMKQAIELAVEEQNQMDGIAGHPVSILVIDDHSEVEAAEDAARRFCQEENLMGVIGHYGSDTSLAAACLYQQYRIPLIAPIASNPLLTGSGLSNVFRYTNRDDHTARAISDHLFHRLLKRKAVVIRSATAYGYSMSKEFKKEFIANGGTITGSLTVKEGQKGFDELIRQLPDDFDLVFYGGTFEGAALLKALREAGFDQLMATGDGCWDIVNFLGPAGLAAEMGEGVLVLSASSAIGDVAGSLTFSKKYLLRYGPIVNYALNARDGVCLLLAALEKAVLQNGKVFNRGQIPDREQLMEIIKTNPFHGIANPNQVSWDERGDNSGAITKLNIIQNGAFKEIT